MTHDSIEDARTALKLHNKYKEMSENGPDYVRQLIKEMYDRGRKLQWKIEPEITENIQKSGEHLTDDKERETQERDLVGIKNKNSS